MICVFSDPACPHCRARNAMPKEKRRQWDALVRSFQTSPVDLSAEALIARADRILTDRLVKLEAPPAPLVPGSRLQ